MTDHSVDANNMVADRVSVLLDLAKRVETGETPIYAALFEAGTIWGDRIEAPAFWRFWLDGANLSAVSAFTKAVLPGWRPEVGWRDGACDVDLMPPPGSPVHGQTGTAPTLCQAWLAAALRALAVEAGKS